MTTKRDIDRMAGPSVRPDGITRPFTVEEQWDRVARYYEFLLRSQEGEDDPLGIGTLEDAWVLASETYQYQGKCTIERGAALRSYTSTPLGVLFLLVGEMRAYPPPELLLALEDCWRVYMDNFGHTTLEKAFLGRSPQGAGPYAKRRAKRLQRFWLELRFRELRAQGKTSAQAAEELATEGKTPSAESIERMMRNIRPSRRTKPEK